MAIENRPYIGTWGMRDQTLVRYTPDCLVYINGYLHIPGCRACNGSIDFQKYITQVTVDPSINSVANASVSLSIPAHASEAFTGDGNYLLRTGLFVTIYMRGYFPMSGVAGKGEQEGSSVADFDASKVPVYPYYQVFRGVVTEVSHEYNGGMYSVSMSCSDFLHFWSNLKVATNGALFGPRPDNSNVQVYLKGHRFTGASPYSIIYSLFRIGFGSAGGVEFTMGRKTNIASVSDATGTTLSKMAGLNQERLFNSRNVNLRMYGMDGTLYNAFTQAYLGAFQDEEQKKVSASALATANAGFDKTPFESTDSMKVNSRALGFNPLSTIAAVGTPTDQPATVNVLQMQAFVQDIQAQGQVNQFETDYMTKLEIAQAVCEVTGFEFYQDVDGDVVFKPAFYNMDTRQDPVYVIKDRDLISLSESDSEPEATYIKGTGSHFKNVSGTGLEGWLGVAAMYADYRLIADFGWREATFETAYLSDARAIYISAINRLDIVNAGRRSASITIPMRPELRPGYPVYIESIGAYYYVEALNHSFQFGGQCTTQITGTAKRAKFHAPGLSGGPITLDSIQLDNPYLPACPLSSEGGEEGPPRYIGFPNVVLSLDPDYLNPRYMLNVANADTIEAVFQVALSYGVIEFTGVGGVPSAAYDGEFVLRTGNDTTSDPFTKADLETQWTEVSKALTSSSTPMPSGKLAEIVAEVQRRQPDSDQEDLINYLVLLNDVKARVAPGMSLTGNYRYYSCSHPTKAHQGQKMVDLDQETTFQPGEVPSPTEPEQVAMFVPNSQVVEFADGTPTGGIRVTALDSEGASSERVLQTSQIKYVTFAKSQTNKIMTVIKLNLAKGYSYNLQINPDLRNVFVQSFISSAANGSPEDHLAGSGGRLQDRWDEIVGEIQTLAEELVIPGADIKISDTSGYTKLKAKYASSLETILDSQSSKRSGSASKTAIEFYGGTDQYGVGAAAARAGKKLYSLTKGTFSIATGLLKTYRKTVKKTLAGQGIDSPGFEGSSYDPTFENVDPLYQARDRFLNAVSDGSASYGTAGGLTTIRASFDNTSKQTVTTPVFPVSDSAGYEVYGSFAYGRGLQVSSYVALLQSAGADGTVIGGTGDTTSLQTLIAVEKYIDTLAKGGSPEEALAAAMQFGGALAAKDIERALAAEGLTVTDGKFSSTMPDERTPDDDGSKAHISGTPSDSSSANQSTLAANAPTELANIDPGTNEICNCKGAEAMFFLQAFSGEYAKLESNEAVQEFLEAEVIARAVPWELSREAMAGQIRDSNYSSLGEKFQKMGSDYAALFSTAASGLEAVPAQFEEAVEDIREPTLVVVDAVTDFFSDDD